MKLIYNSLLISILLLCPASLLADTSSTTPNIVQSHVPETSMASHILSDANSATNVIAQEQPEITPPDEKTMIILPPRDKAEASESQEATPDNNETVAEAAEEGPRIHDPIAPVNKVIYHVNDKIYFWVLKPATQVYSCIIPEDFRIVFGNVYDNLWAPSRMLNNLLQLRFKAAGNEFIRFLFNSVAGIAGVADVARDVLGISKQEADFGQTLGHYGIGHGVYLVLPFFGPSSLRDGIGLAGDRFMYPLTYVNSSDLSFGERMGIYAHEKVNDTSFRIGDYESFKESAIDPYISMRDAFVQHRKKKVEESKH
jgi:phospholipid-binding lipoprotein MlaA